MKIENLEVGMQIPNFKKLCEILDEPEKRGNSKYAQIKEFERYFAYERKGNSYIITQVYDVPKELKDGRQRYVQLLEPIIMNYLAQKYPSEGITWTQWYRQLGMVNERFYDEHTREEEQVFLRANSYTLFLLSNMASRKNKEILSSALSNMKKRNLITFTEKWYIIDKTGCGREASNDLDVYFERIKKHILQDMECSNMQQIFLSPTRYKEYNERFHEIIVSGLWRHAFRTLRIEAVGDVCNLYKNMDVAQMKKQLNREVCKAVKKMATNAFEREIDEEWEIEESGANEEHKRFKYPDHFLWDVEVLIDQLMLT